MLWVWIYYDGSDPISYRGRIEGIYTCITVQGESLIPNSHCMLWNAAYYSKNTDQSSPEQGNGFREISPKERIEVPYDR